MMFDAFFYGTAAVTFVAAVLGIATAINEGGTNENQDLPQ